MRYFVCAAGTPVMTENGQAADTHLALQLKSIKADLKTESISYFGLGMDKCTGKLPPDKYVNGNLPSWKSGYSERVSQKSNRTDSPILSETAVTCRFLNHKWNNSLHGQLLKFLSSADKTV